MCSFFFFFGGGGRVHQDLIIIIIIIPLFITFGDKNYSNITIKIQNTTYNIYISN